MQISRVHTAHCLVGEGPVCDVAEQALYFIDIVGKVVNRFDPATGQTRSWPVPGLIGSMALREKGGAIVALADGVHSLDFETGAVAPLAVLADPDPRVQFNDGKVDRRGRFIVGSTHSDIANTLPLGSVTASARMAASPSSIPASTSATALVGPLTMRPSISPTARPTASTPTTMTSRPARPQTSGSSRTRRHWAASRTGQRWTPMA